MSASELIQESRRLLGNGPIICIRVGSTERSYAVHLSLLCNRVPFFNDMKEHLEKRKVYTVSDVDLEAWDLLTAYLYWDRVPVGPRKPRSHRDEALRHIRSMHQLYQVAYSKRMDDLMNRIMDEIQKFDMRFGKDFFTTVTSRMEEACNWTGYKSALRLYYAVATLLFLEKATDSRRNRRRRRQIEDLKHRNKNFIWDLGQARKLLKQMDDIENLDHRNSASFGRCAFHSHNVDAKCEAQRKHCRADAHNAERIDTPIYSGGSLDLPDVNESNGECDIVEIFSDDEIEIGVEDLDTEFDDGQEISRRKRHGSDFYLGVQSLQSSLVSSVASIFSDSCSSETLASSSPVAPQNSAGCLGADIQLSEVQAESEIEKGRRTTNLNDKSRTDFEKPNHDPNQVTPRTSINYTGARASLGLDHCAADTTCSSYSAIGVPLSPAKKRKFANDSVEPPLQPIATQQHESLSHNEESPGAEHEGNMSTQESQHTLNKRVKVEEDEPIMPTVEAGFAELKPETSNEDLYNATPVPDTILDGQDSVSKICDIDIQLRSTIAQPSSPPSQQARERLYTEKIEIPADMVGCIMGRGGSTIRSFRRISGASILIPNHVEPGTGARIATITGSSTANATALRLIYDVVEQKMLGEAAEAATLVSR